MTSLIRREKGPAGCPIWLTPEIGIVASGPVFAGGGEDVDVDGFFESEDFVRKVGRNDEELAFAEDDFARCAGAVFMQKELEAAGEEVGYLFVDMTVQRDVRALMQGDAGDGNVGTVDELAAEQCVH